MIDRWKLVLVHWVDSHGFHGWHSLHSIMETYSLACVTVGWLVSDEPDRIILISSVQGPEELDPQCDGHMTIPRQSIIRMHECQLIKE